MMASQANLSRAKVHALTLGIVLGPLGASIVWGQAPPTLAPLVTKVDPSVVTITLPNEREGSGFVVDAKGLVVTNYHVIEGAKHATVTFADKKMFRRRRLRGRQRLQRPGTAPRPVAQQGTSRAATGGKLAGQGRSGVRLRRADGLERLGLRRHRGRDSAGP